MRFLQVSDMLQLVVMKEQRLLAKPHDKLKHIEHRRLRREAFSRKLAALLSIAHPQWRKRQWHSHER